MGRHRRLSLVRPVGTPARCLAAASVRSLRKESRRPPRNRAVHRRLSVKLPSTRDGARRYAFRREALDVIRGDRGDEAATGVAQFLFRTAGAAFSQDPPVACRRWKVGSQFFRTLRIPLAAGREFPDHDMLQKACVAILSQSAARAIWPDVPPQQTGQDPAAARRGAKAGHRRLQRRSHRVRRRLASNLVPALDRRGDDSPYKRPLAGLQPIAWGRATAPTAGGCGWVPRGVNRKQSIFRPATRRRIGRREDGRVCAASVGERCLGRNRGTGARYGDCIAREGGGVARIGVDRQAPAGLVSAPRVARTGTSARVDECGTRRAVVTAHVGRHGGEPRGRSGRRRFRLDLMMCRG